MPYKLFTDKSILFECKLELDGASLKNTMARLVIEGADKKFLFEGEVTPGGLCEIQISKLRGLLDENTTGTMKLEIIAEGTYFQPWESDFIVDASKKLAVEVKTPVPAAPTMRCEVITPVSRLVDDITKALRQKNVKLTEARSTHKKLIQETIAQHIYAASYTGDKNEILGLVITSLASQ